MFYHINSRNNDMTKFASYSDQGKHIEETPHCLVMKVDGARDIVINRFTSRVEARQKVRQFNL